MLFASHDSGPTQAGAALLYKESHLCGLQNLQDQLRFEDAAALKVKERYLADIAQRHVLLEDWAGTTAASREFLHTTLNANQLAEQACTEYVLGDYNNAVGCVPLFPPCTHS